PTPPGEGMAPGTDRQRLASARWHEDVEISPVGGNPLNRTAPTPETSAHDPDAGPVVIDDFRNFGGLDVLVARRRHLQGCRQVRPELEAMHFPLAVSLRHFLVENPPPGRHPLHVAGSELTPISQTVAVIDASRQHIGDRLDPAVGMPGKSSAIVFRTIVAEVVEQKEWIELAGIPEAEGATQFHARTLDCRFGLNDSFDGSN